MQKISVDDKKVRDHCHYTGKYGGAAHNAWNVNCEESKKNHVVLHNGFTYHYHFIIKELAEQFKGEFIC